MCCVFYILHFIMINKCSICVVVLWSVIRLCTQNIEVQRDGENNSNTLYVCKGEASVQFQWIYDETNQDKDFIEEISWSRETSTGTDLIMKYYRSSSSLTVEINYNGRVERSSDSTNDIGMILKNVDPADDGQYYVSLFVNKEDDSNDYIQPYKNQSYFLDVIVGVDDEYPLPVLIFEYGKAGDTETVSCSGITTLGDTTLAIFDSNKVNIVSTATYTSVSKTLVNNTVGGDYTCKAYYAPQGPTQLPQGTCLPQPNTVIVPVHGGWDSWSVWNPLCPAEGGATRQRSRTCTKPEPAYGGDNCTDPAVETDICPNGNWSDWSTWTSCSVSCGGGTRSRGRACNDPEPQHGGLNCTGPNGQDEQCNNAQCPTASDPGISVPGTDGHDTPGTTSGTELDLLEIRDVIRDGDDIVVRGSGFKGTSISVKLNGIVCTDTDVTDTEIRCKLSDDMLQKFKGKEVRVVVVVADGSIIHTSDVPYVTTEPLDTQAIIIIVASIAGGLILIIIIIVIVVVCNKRRGRRNQETPQSNIPSEQSYGPQPVAGTGYQKEDPQQPKTYVVTNGRQDTRDPWYQPLADGYQRSTQSMYYDTGGQNSQPVPQRQYPKSYHEFGQDMAQYGKSSEDTTTPFYSTNISVEGQ